MTQREHGPHFIPLGENEELPIAAEVTSEQEADRRFLQTLMAVDPGVFWHINNVAAEIIPSFRGNNPFGAIAEYNIYKFFLDNALRGIPATKEGNEQLKREHSSLHLIEGVMTAYYAFDEVIPEGKLSSDVDFLAMIEYQPNSARLADRLAKEVGRNVKKWDITKLEEEVFTTLFATYLSNRTSTYEQVNVISQKMSEELLRNDPAIQDIKELIVTSPERLADYVGALDNPQEHVDNYRRTHLMNLLFLATIRPHRAQKDKHREALLHYAREITFNEDLRARISRAMQPIDELLPKTQEVLDWKILPPGSLAEHAREIVEAASRSHGKPPVIDLHRLTILENIRKWWGEETSYYTRGIPRTNRSVRTKADKELPDEYLMLILQHVNDAGEVMSEDAVAQSPIAGPNALYLQRQDVNGWDWRELMAYPKYDTISMGTRRLLHTVPEGEDLVTNLTQKVQLLLTSPPEDFTRIEFSGVKSDGTPRIRLTRTLLDYIMSESDDESLE